MDKFFIDNPLLGWIVGLISIVANIMQLVSYYQQRRFQKPYQHAFEQFTRDLQGVHTEEQIQELTKKLAKLESQIRSDIPEQARRAFLEYQLNEMSDEIGHLHSRYLTVAQELGEHRYPDAFSSELKDALTRDILPQSTARQRQQKIIQVSLATILAVVLIGNYGSLMAFFSEKETVSIFSGYSDERAIPIRWVVAFGIMALFLGFIWYNFLNERLTAWSRQKPRRYSVIVAISGGTTLFGMLLLIQAAGNWAKECYSLSTHYYDTGCASLSDWPSRILFVAIVISATLIFAFSYKIFFQRFIRTMFRSARKSKH